MGKRAYFMRMFFLGIMGIFVLGGCAGKDDTQREQELSRSEEGQETVKIEQIGEPEITPENLTEDTTKEPEIKEADWSGYFDGINGAAVLYDADSMEYQVFNRELAETRRQCHLVKASAVTLLTEQGI